MENTKQIKCIKNMRLAGYLMQRGFVLVDIAKNTDGSGRNVFFFNDTTELNNAMSKYLREKR